ncbi:MAG: hypothetical protein HOC20_12895 [Chloroflexi bacterium]|nr:hypothetical protein [Chloroflexota bacterium]
MMAWIGGIIAYMVIRDDDKDKAKRLLIAGLIMTVFWFLANIALTAVSYSLSR